MLVPFPFTILTFSFLVSNRHKQDLLGKIITIKVLMIILKFTFLLSISSFNGLDEIRNRSSVITDTCSYRFGHENRSRFTRRGTPLPRFEKKKNLLRAREERERAWQRGGDHIILRYRNCPWSCYVFSRVRG